MTMSDAWIESPEDTDFELFLQQGALIRVLPGMSNGYWINHLAHWAEKERIPIYKPDYLEIRVVVTQMQLVRFMDEHFPDSEQVSSLREYINHRCKQGAHYVIVADEL